MNPMPNEELLAALNALPNPDLMQPGTLDDPIGSKEFYQARHVVELLAAAQAQTARKLMLDLWDALPAHERTNDCAGSIRATLLFSEVGDEIRATRLNMTA